MNDYTRIKVYCIGLGSQFRNHLSNTLIDLNDKINIIKLCDLNFDRCQIIQNKFKNAGLIQLDENIIEINFNKLLEEIKTNKYSNNCESIFIISTPPETHFKLAYKCLKKGCNVYIDKPFVLKFEEGEKLVEIAERKRKTIVVGAQRRFEGVFQAILKKVKNIRDITKIHLHNHGSFPSVDPFFRESNILPIGIGYHVIDTIVWLIQEKYGNVQNLKLLNSILRKWEENPDAPMIKATFSKKPTIYIYDAYPGGVGFSRKLFYVHDDLLKAAKQLILECPCKTGCPSCIGPALKVGELGKGSSLKLLEYVIEH